MNNLKKEFAKYATRGYLGNPLGEDAYAYLRASSERQVEEGTSFSRQIQTVHMTAERDDLRIPFELIFFDDGYTGFEFEHRPALLKLLYEVKTKPRAMHLILEDIDRLSRNADWQQGFLLEEFGRRNIDIHFYINPGSALERYIRGYMAQEEMRKAKERMILGNKHKAMSGKVTAKRPRYGYVITKDSRYDFHPEESKVMRWVYEQLIYHGRTLHQIAKDMNAQGIPTRFKPGFWSPSTLYQLVKSPVYKGVFYANKHRGVKTGEYKENGKPKQVMRLRPKEEWIRVDVPAIVSPEEWEMAMEVMNKNAKRSLRNSKKRNWLLAGGLMKCAICREYSMITVIGGTKNTRVRYYACNSRNSNKARGLGTSCLSPYVLAEIIEERVWEEIESVIYEPELLLKRYDERVQEEELFGYQEQIEFIEKQISELMVDREKFEAAYQRDIYTLDEFEEKMLDIRKRYETFKKSQEEIKHKLEQSQIAEDKKDVLLATLNLLKKAIDDAKRSGKKPSEVPFKLKRKIITLIIDVIWVDSEKGVFQMEGAIRKTITLDDPKEKDNSNNGQSNSGTKAESGEDSNVSSPRKSNESKFGLASDPIWRLCASCRWCGTLHPGQAAGRCRCPAKCR